MDCEGYVQPECSAAVVHNKFNSNLSLFPTVKNTNNSHVMSISYSDEAHFKNYTNYYNCIHLR